MFDVRHAGIPSVKLNGAHLHQRDESASIVNVDVGLTFAVPSDSDAMHGRRRTFSSVALKEARFPRPLWATNEADWPVASLGQQPRRHGRVVARQLELGNATVRPQHALRVRNGY